MKVGLLLGPMLSDFNQKVLYKILSSKDWSVRLAIVDQASPLSLKKRIIKNIKKGRGGYIIIMAIQKYLRKNAQRINTINFAQNNNIKVIPVQSPYEPRVIEAIIKNNIDILLLINGFGIIKEPLLSSCPGGVISYHHGDMRKYRGQPPAFWELYNGESEMGVTVQILDEGLDKGIPIVEKKIPISKFDSLGTLRERAYKDSEDMLYTALMRFKKNEFEHQRIKYPGKVYTLPNFRQWIVFYIKIFYRLCLYKIFKL